MYMVRLLSGTTRVSPVAGMSLVGRKESHTTSKGYLRYYVLVCASNAVGVLVEEAGLYQAHYGSLSFAELSRPCRLNSRDRNVYFRAYSYEVEFACAYCRWLADLPLVKHDLLGNTRAVRCCTDGIWNIYSWLQSMDQQRLLSFVFVSWASV